MCNEAFVRMSGFAQEDLLGAPHSILRHPDTPKAAFYADLWATVNGAGRRWSGCVKNLRKDGGFYWVYATVIPMVRDGVIVGHTSVRRQPSRAKVKAAAGQYTGTAAGRVHLVGETMTRHFAVIDPDVHPRGITDWFLLSTRIQRLTSEPFRATASDDFADPPRRLRRRGGGPRLRQHRRAPRPLVRDHRIPADRRGRPGWATRRPSWCPEYSRLQILEDSRGGLTVAATDAPDVERICRYILLEPADVGPDQIPSPSGSQATSW